MYEVLFQNDFLHLVGIRHPQWRFSYSEHSLHFIDITHVIIRYHKLQLTVYLSYLLNFAITGEQGHVIFLHYCPPSLIHWLLLCITILSDNINSFHDYTFQSYSSKPFIHVISFYPHYNPMGQICTCTILLEHL